MCYSTVPFKGPGFSRTDHAHARARTDIDRKIDKSPMSVAEVGMWADAVGDNCQRDTQYIARRHSTSDCHVIRPLSMSIPDSTSPQSLSSVIVSHTCLTHTALIWTNLRSGTAGRLERNPIRMKKTHCVPIGLSSFDFTGLIGR